MSSKKHQSAIESNNAFMVKIEDLVKEILIQNGMPYYRLDSDVKSVTTTDGNHYVPVIRVITYFEDTVGKIADILQAEFDVAPRPADKSRRGETFSYKNVQYLAGLRANRQELTEYKRSAGRKFEIQVCSMLSDAWLGIEKELSYDVANISDEIKRDFYRVGALLEMADIEFLKIRTLLNQGGTEGTEPVQQQAAGTTFSEHLRAVATAVPEIKPSYEAHAYMVQKGTQSTLEQPQPQYAANNGMPQQQYAPQQAIPNNQGAIVPQAANMVQENIQTQAGSYQEMYNNAAAEAANMANSYAVPGMANAAQNMAQQAPQQQQYTQPQQQYTPPVQPQQQYAPQPMQQPAPQPQAYTQPQAPQQPAYTQSAPPPQHQYVPPQYITPNQPAQQYAAPAPPPNTAGNVAAGAAGGVIGTEILEKAMEIIREHGTPEKVIPFYEDQPQKEAVPAPFDENAQMTDATLKDYVMKSKLVKEVDMQIAERAGAKLNPEVDIEGDVDRLRFLRVHSLMQLHEKIQDNSNDIVAFAEKWIGKDNGGSFDSGICLFYLEYLLVGKKNDPAFAVEYVVKFISDNDYSARYIIPTYNSIRNTEATPASHAHLTLK